MIPVGLAWLGVLASVLLVVLCPLQLAGLLGGPVTQFMWLPMLVFEVVLALWLIIKGAGRHPGNWPGHTLPELRLLNPDPSILVSGPRDKR